MLKRLLMTVPGAVKIVHDARYLKKIARERWLTDRRLMNDNSHIQQEWDHRSAAEQDRYQRVLGLVTRFRGPAGWGDVLEIGCSEGLFTALLAPRCDRLTACDISPVALARAERRVSSSAHLGLELFDLILDPITGNYDTVFAMDVLEFVHGRDLLTLVARKLAHAVRPGGLLILSICRLPEQLQHRWWCYVFPEGADHIIELLSGRFGLEIAAREVHSVPEDSAYIEHILTVFRKIEGPS
jgi:2-polyprenyl-3-methyl-5-hydroxy-6-metoxy-1,4-benzoquinol methylase